MEVGGVETSNAMRSWKMNASVAMNELGKGKKGFDDDMLRD